MVYGYRAKPEPWSEEDCYNFKVNTRSRKNRHKLSSKSSYMKIEHHSNGRIGEIKDRKGSYEEFRV